MLLRSRFVSIFLSLAICSSLTAFSAVRPSQKSASVPSILNGVHRVVCLGDSITQMGEGQGGYVWLVRQYLKDLYPDAGIETLNAGISGHKSTDMLARFQSDVLDKKPDLVTISVGVNDVWHGFYDNHPMGDGPRGVTLEHFRTNVETMVTRALAAGIKVVILSTTVIEEDLSNRENAKAAKYNSALHDLARAHHCAFVDFLVPFRNLIQTYRRTTGGRDNLLTVDGVHMNGAGNKVMAHTLLTGLGISPEDQQSVQKQVEKSR